MMELGTHPGTAEHYPWVALCPPGGHPLDGLWDEGFVVKDDADRLDVTIRALRGMVVRHRPVVIRSLTLQQAKRFVAFCHSHAPSLTGWKFGTSIWDDIGMIGMVAVGRPVARLLDNGQVLEINRCCLMDNAPKNAASMLIGRACRVAADLGYRRIISYTLASEDGTSLKATGFKPVALSPGGEHDRPSRRREPADFDTGGKVRWEKELC